jgi:hypothetical protein
MEISKNEICRERSQLRMYLSLATMRFHVSSSARQHDVNTLVDRTRSQLFERRVPNRTCTDPSAIVHKGNPTICRPTWNPHRPPRRPYARFLYFLTGSPFWQRFRVLLVPVVLLANHRVSGGVLCSNEKTHKKRPRNRSTSAVRFAFATRKRKTPAVRFSATQPVRHERCFRLSRTRHVRTTGKRDGRGHVGVSGFCTFAKTQHRTPSDNYLQPLI